MSQAAAEPALTKAPRATLVQVLSGGRQALVLDRVTGEYGVFKVGDTIHGLRVSEIEPDQLVLATPTPPERYYVLPLVEGAPVPGGAAGAAGSGAAGSAGEPGAGSAAAGAAAPPAPSTARGPDSSSAGAPSSAAGPPAAGEAGAQPGDPEAIDPYAGAAGSGSGDSGSGGSPGGASEPPDSESSIMDPYGGDSSSTGDTGLPSVIAPPASRVESAPPPPRRGAAGPSPKPAAPPSSQRDDRAPELRPAAPAAPDLDASADGLDTGIDSGGETSIDTGGDLDPGAADADASGDTGIDSDAEAGPDADTAPPTPARGKASRARDSKLKTAKSTEAHPAVPSRSSPASAAAPAAGAAPATGAAPAAGPAPAAPSPAADEPTRLSRRELDWALSDFSALAKQIQIERAPGGGMRVVDLASGSFVARLGIQRGDVVKRVAGHPIDTVDEAAAAYAALASAREVVVEIVRRGEPVRLRYRLTR